MRLELNIFNPIIKKIMSQPKDHKKTKTVTTSEFILVLLFIYLAVVSGLLVKINYFD